MKFSAIFMIALASIAAASDRNAMPKSCDDCKKFFDACMRVSVKHAKLLLLVGLTDMVCRAVTLVEIPVLPLAVSILAAPAPFAKSTATTRNAKVGDGVTMIWLLWVKTNSIIV